MAEPAVDPAAQDPANERIDDDDDDSADADYDYVDNNG